jgi:PAS domain S-box-containing protein
MKEVRMDALIPQSLKFRLKFPPEIESKFQEDYHEKTISTSRLAVLMGLFLIAAFGFLDQTTAPQSYLIIWVIRYRIVVPILGLILLLTFFPRLKTWTQFIIACGVLVSTLGITAMGAVTHSGEAAFSTYYVGVLLALMAGYTFARLRFWHAAAIGLVTLITYECTALGIQHVLQVPMGAEIFYNNNFFVVSANLIGMFASYFMERYARLDYLQRRQIEEAKALSESMLQAEAAQALRESEARFRSLVEISTEGVIIIDQAGSYQYVSPAIERILGYHTDELIGRLAFDFIHPDDLELAQREFAQLLQAPDYVVMAELRAIRKDGEVRILESSAKRLPNGDIVAYSHDITDRKQADEKLRTSEAYYRSIIENSVDGLTLVDPTTGKFNYISPSFERLLGYSLDELNTLGSSVLMHPNETEQAQTDAIKMIANPGQAIISNGHLLHKNGEWIGVESSCKILPSGEILGNFRDITERKLAEEKLRESEAEFRSLIENSSDGIVIFGRQGIFQYVSPGLTRIVGWEANELIGKTWHDFAHPNDLAYTRSIFHQLFENPGQVIVHESRFRHKDGTWRLMEVVGKLHPNGCVVTNSRDITERKMAEQKLRESEDHYRSLIENVPDIIAILNANGIYEYTNPAFERILGWSAKESIGTVVSSYVHPDDLPKVWQAVAEAFANPGTPRPPIEFQTQHQDGSWRIIEAVGWVRADGKLVVNARDVSARRQAEEQLRQLNEELEQRVEERTAEVKRLAAIIETTSDLVGIGNLQGLGVYINRAGRKMLGLGETDDISQTPFLDYYAAHSQPVVLQGIETVLQGESWSHELSMRHHDGHEIPASQVSFVLYDSNGQPEYLTAIVRDMSVQKRVEAELKTAKEFAESALAESKRLAAIIEAMPDYVGIADRQGNSLYVNRAGRHLVGKPEVDNSPWNVVQCYPADATEQLQPMFQAMQRGEAWVGELDLRHLDGHRIPTDHVIFPLRAANGQIESYAAIIRDITERKQAEVALRESEERFRTIAQASPIPIIISRISDGTILFANPSLSDLIRVPLDQVVGQKTPNFYYDPTDRIRILTDVKNKGFVRDFEFRGRRADQTDFWAAITIQPLMYDGEEVMLAGIYEITELKQIQLELQHAKEAAEAALAESKRLSTIIEATSDMVATADLQGTLTYLNRAGRQLAGLSDEGEIDHFRLTDFYPPEVLPIVQQRIGYNIAQGLDADLFETMIQRHDGSQVPVSIVGIIHRTSEGAPQSLSAVVRDITEQKLAEAELKQAKDIAETANKAKSTFLANMSHEIRTPMNAVIGMTSLLLETPLIAKQRDFVETIRSSGDVLLTIINDILDFSKIEAGKLELVNRPLDLRNTIETTLDLLAPRIAEKNLNVAYSMEHDVPHAIQGDATRLRQILVNLVGNAVKFTEKGEIVIRVDALQLKQGQDGTPSNYELHFQVHDTGIGIPADKQDRLFQSFSQVDASSTRVYGGTGLGLAISKRLAEMMGGVMWVESTGIPGEGTTFHFTMEAVEANLPSPKVSRGYVAELTGKKILLVDDHQTNLQILQLQTEAWGMMPQTASSSEDALALLEKGIKFDIAILDSQMPDLNGFGLAKRIRDREAGQGPGAKRLPLILLASVLDSEADPANLFDALLTKPVKPSNLFDVLMTAFDANDSARTQYPKNQKESFNNNVELMASQYPLRILLAEDVVVNQKFALLALERMGYRADVVANGQEAIEAIRRQPYDVVLMDINMPVMDGYEASRHIHELWKNGGRPFDIARPWIIAMTANALQGDRELALEAGADDYISKPVYLNELQMVLARAGHERKDQSGGVMPISQPEDAKLNQVYLQGLLNLPDGKSLIEAYLEESPNMLEQLGQAVQNQNARELKDAAHALKGSSLYVGAEEVAELAKALELAGRSNDLQGVEQVLSDLEKAYSKVAVVLKGILNS